jgi:hypothetical protein
MGDGTLQEALNWLEYCNGMGKTFVSLLLLIKHDNVIISGTTLSCGGIIQAGMSHTVSNSGA